MLRPGFLACLASVLALTACEGAAAPTPGGSPSATASTEPTDAPTASPTPSPSATAVTNADGTVSIDVPRWPMILLPGDDALWGTVYEATKRVVIRIDPETYEVTTVLDDLPIEQLHGIGVGGSLWMSYPETNTVVEYDAETGEELTTLTVGDFPIEPLFALGDVWTLDHHGGTVTRIDPATSTVVATIRVGETGEGGPATAGVAGGLLWVASPNTPKVVGIDPDTNEIAKTIEVAADCQPGVGGVADRLWLGDCVNGKVLDPQTLEQVGDLSELPPGYGLAGDLVTTGDRVWVTEYDREADAITGLAAVDLESFQVVGEFRLEPLVNPSGASAFDSIWIASAGKLLRIPATALSD